MNFIAGLALIFLALVGYSSGSVLGTKERTAVPSIVDLLIIVVLWIAAFATRSALGKWGAIGTWVVVGLVLGAILARARASSYPRSQMPNAGSGLWNTWKNFAQRMGNYQSRVLIALVYFTVVLPFGLGVTLFGDPLKLKRAYGDSNWQSKELPLRPSLDEARRQS